MNPFRFFHGAEKLRKLFSPQDKRKFLGIVLLMALSGFLEMAGIGVLAGTAVIFLSPSGQSAERVLEWFRSIFPGASQTFFFLTAVGVVALILVLKNLFALFIVSVQSRFVQQKQNELSCRMFYAYLKSDFRFLSGRSAGECSGNVERIPQMCQNYLQTKMQILADGIVIFFLAAAVLILLPGITLAGIFFLFLCGGGIYAATRKINGKLGEKLEHNAEVESRIRLAGLLGVQEIKVSGSEEFFLRRFQTFHSALSRTVASIFTLGQIPRLSMEVFALLFVAGLFGILLLSGEPKEEIFFTFTIIVAGMARILPALSRCHYNLTLNRQYQAMFDAITDELDRIPPETAKNDGPFPDAGQVIRFEDLSFAYTPGKEILSSLSFAIEPGGITGIAGKSGAGKSTAAYLLLGLLHPDAGRITAGGADIDGNLAVWRKQLGFVPQSVFLFDGTIRENVAFGEESGEIDDEKVRRALTLAQLTDFLGRENEWLHAGGASLSGGQKQRLGIARALYREPKLLILDEATSALDPGTENALCEVLTSLRGKLTVFLISHREATLRICDTVIPITPPAE